MAESFQTILQRYVKSQIPNPRTTAQGFQRLAEQGSIAAALTFGLLSARADEAEAQDRRLAAAVQGRKLELDERRVAADELRAESLANLQTSQAKKVDVETGLLPEDSKALNTLRAAQASGALTDAQYRDVQTSILSKYGGAEAQAGIIQKLAAANTQKAQARNLNANASVTEATGIDTARQQIAESQGRTYAAVKNADTGRIEAGNLARYQIGTLANNAYANRTGRINANANAALTGQRAVGQSITNQLDATYGGAEKVAAINESAARSNAAISNAATNARNADINSYRAYTDKLYRDGVISNDQKRIAIDKYIAESNNAFRLSDAQINAANTKFQTDIKAREYNDDKQRRRFEILGTQIGAINDLDVLRKRRDELTEDIKEAREGPWYNVFGLFSDEEKADALLEARRLLDQKINLFEQALR